MSSECNSVTETYFFLITLFMASVHSKTEPVLVPDFTISMLIEPQKPGNGYMTNCNELNK